MFRHMLETAREYKWQMFKGECFPGFKAQENICLSLESSMAKIIRWQNSKHIITNIISIHEYTNYEHV